MEKDAGKLKLTSHDLFAVAPGTPAIGPALRVEVSSETRASFTAVARLVMIYTNQNERDYYRVFFKDEKRPADEIFSSGGRCIVAEPQPISSEKLLARTTKAANAGIVTRFWKAPDLAFGLALSSCGMGSIVRKSGEPGNLIDFYWGSWEDEDQFWEWNTYDFQAFCRQMLADADSQLNFYLRWLSWPAIEKTAYTTRLECGDWEQMVELFTKVLQLITHYFGPYYEENWKSSFWDFTRPIPSRYDRPAVLFARRWQKTLFDIIRPSFWPTTPLCAHQWRCQKEKLMEEVRCEVPTMHEVLEAQVRLHEFLRPHLSPGEIEDLLKPNEDEQLK